MLDAHIKIKLEKIIREAQEAIEHIEFKNIMVSRLDNIRQEILVLIEKVKQSEAEKELMNLFEDKTKPK